MCWLLITLISSFLKYMWEYGNLESKRKLVSSQIKKRHWDVKKNLKLKLKWVLHYNPTARGWKRKHIDIIKQYSLVFKIFFFNTVKSSLTFERRPFHVCFMRQRLFSINYLIIKERLILSYFVSVKTLLLAQRLIDSMIFFFFLMIV